MPDQPTPAQRLTDPAIRRLAVDGQRSARERGQRWCRCPPLGYKWVGRPARLAIDHEVRQLAARVVDLRDHQGLSCYGVGARLLWESDGAIDMSLTMVWRLYNAARTGRLTMFDAVVDEAARTARSKAGKVGSIKRKKRADKAKMAFWTVWITHALRNQPKKRKAAPAQPQPVTRWEDSPEFAEFRANRGAKNRRQLWDDNWLDDEDDDELDEW